MEIKDIIGAVCSYYGVSEESVKKAYKQNYPINVAKGVSIYIMLRHGGIKKRDVAAYFGVCDRTIEYRYRWTEKIMSPKTKLHKEYVEILQTLNINDYE